MVTGGAASVGTGVEAELGWIEFRRARTHNALDELTLKGLREAVTGLASTPGVRVLAIVGAGDVAFSAGADVHELRARPPADRYAANMLGHEVFDVIERCPLPVVAALNGRALGGGLELALACDIRVATHDAVLGLPEVTLGVMPAWGGTFRLAELIGAGPARELILTGRSVTADEARALGLVSRVVARDELRSAVAEIARTLARNSGAAMAAAKAAMAAARLDRSRLGALESGEVGALGLSEEFESRASARFGARRDAMQGMT